MRLPKGAERTHQKHRQLSPHEATQGCRTNTSDHERPVNLKFLRRAPFYQNGAKSGFEMCFGPSTLGAGAKTRLESRIKKFTPHQITSGLQLYQIKATIAHTYCMVFTT